METFSVSVNAVSYTVATELSTTDDPFNGPIKNIAPWNFTILAVLMFVVTSLSLTENFLVMFVTFKFKQLRQPLNYIIVNLAIADFLVSLTGGVISFLTNARGYFFLGKWACVLEGFAVTFFVTLAGTHGVSDCGEIGIVALWSLAVLSFERFFVICRPLGNIRLQAKHAILGLLFVWTFSFIWTFPPVLGWNRYTVSKIGTTCEPDWYSTNITDHSYILTFFTTCFILPLGVIFFCYGKLLRKLRKVSHGRLATARKPERQVTRMVVVMIVAFMVGWTPYAVFSILVTAHPTIELDPRLASIPAFFSKTAAVYNPIIYVFMNKQENLQVDPMSLKERLPPSKLLRRRVPDNREQTVTAEISIDKEPKVESGASVCQSGSRPRLCPSNGYTCSTSTSTTTVQQDGQCVALSNSSTNSLLTTAHHPRFHINKLIHQKARPPPHQSFFP